MAVPNSMSDLAQLPASNYPTGSELIGTNLDNYLRAHAAILRQLYAMASDAMPAASTINVSATDGEAVLVTGSATINSLGTGYAGCRRELHFAGACTIVHSNNIRLPFGDNVVTQAGMALAFRCLEPGQWRQVSNSTSIDLTILNAAIEEALGAGGNYTVTPRFWSGVGDDATADFPIPGADIPDPLFYDTAIETAANSGEYVVARPGDDFTIDVTDDPEETAIRFTSNVPEDVRWFTVLRGYARPYIGATPITRMDLRTPIVDVPDMSYAPGIESEFALLRCTNVVGCEITIEPVPVEGAQEDKLYTGSFFSVKQVGLNPAEIVAGDGVVLDFPGDCLPQTRAQNSVITATCDDADQNIWTISGDMAEAAA